MNLQKEAEKALKLRQAYLDAKENGDTKLAIRLELEYMRVRKPVLEAVDNSTKERKSTNIKIIKDRVANMPKKPRYATGLLPLDRMLVPFEELNRNTKGGFELGNFIQIAGSKGAGKSTFLMKIMSSFTTYTKVVWFDFEMGSKRVVKKMSGFNFNDDNLFYYEGGRDLDEIIDEIKLMYADGAEHFVIDSAMKINIKSSDRYEKFSTISNKLSELTSTLNINIYLINQMSQEAVESGVLKIKHGNDAEYDSDFIFFLLKFAEKDEHGRVKKDEFGMPIYDNNERVLVCDKNRQDEHEFKVKLSKFDMLNITQCAEYEFNGDDNGGNIEMPKI